MCIYEHLLYIQNAFVKNVYTGSKPVISRNRALVYTNLKTKKCIYKNVYTTYVCIYNKNNPGCLSPEKPQSVDTINIERDL